MDIPIVVVNRIGKLRRQTVKNLEEYQFSKIKQAVNIETAEDVVRMENEELIVIFELTSEGISFEEERFLMRLMIEHNGEGVSVIVISRIASRNLINQLIKLHVKDFVLRRNNESLFINRLIKAIEKCALVPLQCF